MLRLALSSIAVAAYYARRTVAAENALEELRRHVHGLTAQVADLTRRVGEMDRSVS